MIGTEYRLPHIPEAALKQGVVTGDEKQLEPANILEKAPSGVKNEVALLGRRVNIGNGTADDQPVVRDVDEETAFFLAEAGHGFSLDVDQARTHLADV